MEAAYCIPIDDRMKEDVRNMIEKKETVLV